MPAEDASTAAYRRPAQPHPGDLEVARLAERQHGVVARRQLAGLGIGAGAIERRIRAGRLHRLHPGVYAVGHRCVSREGMWLAAVMRGGEGTVLSHRSAATLWAVRREGPGWIEVSSPRASRSCAGIHRHRVRHLSEETTTRHGIPVTTLLRTLFDLASVLPAEALEAAIREAEYLHGLQRESLALLLERHPGQRGTAALRSCLRHVEAGPRGRTRSRLEDRFAALVGRTGLPRPQLNALLELGGRRIEADCLWRDQRVVVELDGGRAHRTRAAFEADRERDRHLQAAGWRVVRITWRQMDDPDAILRDLKRLLSPEDASTAA